MNANSARHLRQRIKKTKVWLTETQPTAPASCFVDLDRGLAEGNLHGLRVVAIRLGVLASYYARKATIHVIDGDLAGWEEVHKSVAYQLWYMKIMFETFRAAPPAPVYWPGVLRADFTVTALLFCYYVAGGSEAGQRYTIDLLKVLAKIAEERDRYFWESRTFELFVLRLDQKQEKLDLPDSLENRDLGPYGKVLEYWDTPSRLADAIYDLCDYHCSNLFDTGQDWDAMFGEHPFDLLPCEIQAIYAIRQKSGLETPRVEHPLLATPLADFKREPEFHDDDVLVRVRAAYATMFPDAVS
jgi:hypothetical protein